MTTGLFALLLAQFGDHGLLLIETQGRWKHSAAHPMAMSSRRGVRQAGKLMSAAGFPSELMEVSDMATPSWGDDLGGVARFCSL
jgi:hypothetical protein